MTFNPIAFIIGVLLSILIFMLLTVPQDQPDRICIVDGASVTCEELVKD